MNREELVKEMMDIDGTLNTQIILQKVLNHMGIEYEIAEDKVEAFEVEKPHFPFTTTPADPATKPHPVDALNKMSQQNQKGRCIVM